MKISPLFFLLQAFALSAAFQVNVPHPTRSTRILKLPPSIHTQDSPTSPAYRYSTATRIKSSVEDNDDPINPPVDLVFNGQTMFAIVGGQSLLIVGAVVAAKILNVPNLGLGADFVLNSESIRNGAIATIPLIALAFFLDKIEDNFPALTDVSKATQRSVLGLLGGSRRPLIALAVSIALGVAAGLGEEMVFRGILQSELSERFGDVLALTSSALIFGALHAVTPLYAILAGVASLYFGELFLQYHNLAVPIVCHGLYDVGALMAAHLEVTSMSDDEKTALVYWDPPVPGQEE